MPLITPLALQAWTHQEVRAMMHHLKERGKFHKASGELLE
jgi:hypothetical protein